MERVTRFDLIRVSKILEIAQAATVSLLICIYMGTFFDQLCIKMFDNNVELEKKSSVRLMSEIFVQFVGVVIVAFYVRKITTAVPFLFSLDKSYVPNMKNETSRGIGMGTKIVFFLVQSKLRGNLVEFTKRLREYI